jgi:hypothetical protein
MKQVWRVLIAKSEIINDKIHQISIFGFRCVAMNTKGWLKICASYMVYTQIWLNLFKDDSHFFNIFLCMIAT